MKSLEFISEAFRRVIALCDLPNVVIEVCGKQFSINQSLLPFISTELTEYFDKFDEPFIISINDDDLSNSLFESVSSESLIESCSIFLSFFENGIYNVESRLHIPSLILFCQKIFSHNLPSSIIDFSKSFDQSPPPSLSPSFLSFHYSIFSMNSFTNISNENDNDNANNEFSFKIFSKVYKCSTSHCCPTGNRISLATFFSHWQY
jgi:hypothetical protein